MVKKKVHHKAAHHNAHHGKRHHKHYIHPKKLGVALGLTAAIYIFLLGSMAALFDWGSLIVRMISTVYIGYGTTLGGILLGMIWAFIDCFIAGFIFALIYNKVQDCNWNCKLMK